MILTRESVRPKIGVTLSARRNIWIWFLHRLAILRSGGVPVKITPECPKGSTKGLDGLVVGGGDDISFQLEEGELNPNVRYDPARDRLEKTLLEDAFARDLPVLGICRGAQMINVVRGGTLYKDVSEISDKAPKGRMLLPRKIVLPRRGTLLARIMECARCRVNALHHQSVRKPGDGVHIVAHDTEDIVQAIEVPEAKYTVGVQWHPEMLPFSRSHMNLFRSLVAASSAA